jgi:type IV secretion system protein TrbL
VLFSLPISPQRFSSLAMVESYLVIGAGSDFSWFGGSRWTAAYVEGYIAYAVSVGMKILCFLFACGPG